MKMEVNLNFRNLDEYSLINTVYSLFALAEYALVVTNIAFHSIVYVEFWDTMISLPCLCC